MISSYRLAQISRVAPTMKALPGDEMNFRISAERTVPVRDDVGGQGR